MRHSLFFISAILFLTLFMSCSHDQEQEGKNDCVFEQNDDDMDGRIDETESSIMKACTEEAFTSIDEIKSNLIGEWELIGHGEGWIPTISQPCGYITFTEEAFEFDFNDGHTDTLILQSWDIEQVDWIGGTYFRLKTEPNYFHSLFATQFCSQYFYGDATPRDGNMYLYEKVK